MPLKMECHSKWNVTQNRISLRMECHSKWYVTQNGMSPKMEFHSKWNVTKIGMSLKIESKIRHKDFFRPSSFVLLRHAQGTPPGF